MHWVYPRAGAQESWSVRSSTTKETMTAHRPGCSAASAPRNGRRAEPVHRGVVMTEPKYTGKMTDFYVASEAIADIVNLAINLKRPILVEGEPGCGKTKLASSISSEKQLGDIVKINVKSTSRAQDLLYRVNSLRRLQDAQNTNNQNAQYVYPYLSLGPLGDV